QIDGATSLVFFDASSLLSLKSLFLPLRGPQVTVAVISLVEPSGMSWPGR
ncbi:unnamed protein product, partial [Musa acuminata var. zebrina]